MLMSEAGRQCPECRGVVPDDARKCRHCGSDLPTPAVAHDLGNPYKLNLSEQVYYAIIGEETQGPYSIIELCHMWREKKLNGKTLCAKNGDSKWITLEELRG
jgi:hypothetical protein